MNIRKLISPTTMKQKSDTIDGKSNSHKMLKTSLIALAVAGTTLAIVAPYTKKDVLKALKSKGLEVKNGLVVSASTGEKYTGDIKFNSKVFGFEKETVKYVDGLTSEILHHDFMGKEVNAKFYKEGKLYLFVGDITRDRQLQHYPFIRYNLKTQEVDMIGDGSSTRDISIFNKFRKAIAEGKV